MICNDDIPAGNQSQQLIGISLYINVAFNGKIIELNG